MRGCEGVWGVCVQVPGGMGAGAGAGGLVAGLVPPTPPPPYPTHPLPALAPAAARADVLERALPGAYVEIVSNIHELPPLPPAGFLDRSGALFVGAMTHVPNLQAVQLLLEDVLPRFMRLLPARLRCACVGGRGVGGRGVDGRTHACTHACTHARTHPPSLPPRASVQAPLPAAHRGIGHPPRLAACGAGGGGAHRRLPWLSTS